MSGSNKVVIAAAGSGKTTYIVEKALGISDGNVLITTFTESNEAEIRNKIVKLRGHIPSNICVSTWFAFLIAHGVRPFQGALFDFDVKGTKLCERQSGFRYSIKGRPVYWGESDFRQYYFDSHQSVYSDKLSKLVIQCDSASGGCVFNRISRIWKHIFVDEAQDLAGYDLDIVVRFFASDSNVLLVGDPRQTVFQTHHERRYGKYSGGKMREFFSTELPRGIPYSVDDTSLRASHRNNAAICDISSRLYPALSATIPCTCEGCRSVDPVGAGLCLVKKVDVASYLEEYKPVQLRYSSSTKGINPQFPVLNFGVAKGLGFDRVLIFPTADMVGWMKDNNSTLEDATRAKFYVAMTRARHSVAIVYDYKSGEVIHGFTAYQ